MSVPRLDRYIQEGNYRAFKTLLNRIGDVSAYPILLRRAVAYGDIPMMKLLIEHGADVYDQELITLIDDFGDLEYVRRFLLRERRGKLPVRTRRRVLYGK